MLLLERETLPKIFILIVEDESLIALGLAMAIEDVGAVVIGPVATVADAPVLLDGGGIDAAVIDANLLDGFVTPVAMRLAEQWTARPDFLANLHAP